MVLLRVMVGTMVLWYDRAHHHYSSVPVTQRVAVQVSWIAREDNGMQYYSVSAFPPSALSFLFKEFALEVHLAPITLP